MVGKCRQVRGNDHMYAYGVLARTRATCAYPALGMVVPEHMHANSVPIV